MTIVAQSPLPPALLKEFQCAVKECDRKPLTKAEQKRVSDAAPRQCQELGTLKHECVDEKMSKNPDARTERSYDMKQRPPRSLKDASGAETQGYLAAKKAAYAQFGYMAKGRFKRPDVIFGKRAPYHVLDAKFPCSEKVKSGQVDAVNLSARGVSGASMMSDDQRAAYQKIANGSAQQEGTVTAVSPADAAGVQC
jgi:hypothetical protein